MTTEHTFHLSLNETRKIINSMLKEFKEIVGGLCKEGDKLHIVNIKSGSKEWVKAPKQKCDKGEFFGDIHTHTEEKGISDADIFQEVKWNLNNSRVTPRLSCVIYPKYTKDDVLNKLCLECDYIKKFGEKEISEIPDVLGEKRKKENIEFLKYGDIRSVGGAGWGGMFQRLGFITDMYNIRNNLIKRGYIDVFKTDVAYIKKSQKPNMVSVSFSDIILKFKNDKSKKNLKEMI